MKFNKSKYLSDCKDFQLDLSEGKESFKSVFRRNITTWNLIKFKNPQEAETHAWYVNILNQACSEIKLLFMHTVKSTIYKLQNISPC